MLQTYSPICIGGEGWLFCYGLSLRISFKPILNFPPVLKRAGELLFLVDCTTHLD